MFQQSITQVHASVNAQLISIATQVFLLTFFVTHGFALFWFMLSWNVDGESTWNLDPEVDQ